MDNYFHDPTAFPAIEGQPDWDIPASLNFSLLFENLSDLKAGKKTAIPLFQKETLERTYKTVEPQEIILAEGFLLYFDECIRDLFDLKFYIDTPEDVQLGRRSQCDSARKEYIRTVVIPNYRKYGLPYKKYADILLDGTRSPDELRKEIERASLQDGKK